MRAKQVGKFWNALSKIPPDNAENLDILFSEMYILKILEWKMGGQTLDPL